MYHRFEENKYPSTNIKILDFKKHLEIINENNINLLIQKILKIEIVKKKSKKDLAYNR